MKNQTQKIIFTGLLIAIGVILAQFLSIAIPPSQTLFKIGIGYLSLILISLLFGPFYGLFAGIAQDLIGFFLWASSQGVFYFGFTLNAALVGVIPWLIIKFIKWKPIIYKWFNILFMMAVLGVSIGLFFNIGLITSRIPDATDTLSYVLAGTSVFASLLIGVFLVTVKAENDNHLLIFIVIIVLLLIQIVLTPIWVRHLYGVSFWIQLPPRIIKLPFEVIAYSLLLIRLYPLLKKLTHI